MGTLDEVFGGMLVDSGLERLGDKAIYRGSVSSEISPGRQHNVFVNLEDDACPQIMSPIGIAEQLGDHDLASSRNANDGCNLAAIASYVALTRQLDINRIVSEPGVMVSEAIALAAYADLVGEKLTQRQARKEELLGEIQKWLSDTTAVSSGQVSVEAFLGTVDSALDLVPQPGLLAQIHDVASRTSLLDWARDETGAALNAVPWSRVTDGLEAMRAERGWPEPLDIGH